MAVVHGKGYAVVFKLDSKFRGGHLRLSVE